MESQTLKLQPSVPVRPMPTNDPLSLQTWPSQEQISHAVDFSGGAAAPTASHLPDVESQRTGDKRGRVSPVTPQREKRQRHDQSVSYQSPGYSLAVVDALSAI